MTFTMEQYRASAQAIRARLGGFTPKVAMILGSGLGFLGDEVQDPVAVDYHDIPYFKASTAPGHRGRLVFGVLEGQNVAVMQGRMHHYEGYSYEEVVYAVRVLRLLGFFSAISILPVYLSLVTFHQAFMPLSLILSIAKARQDVPFSILGESFLLLLAFDILWEAGVRTPSNIGQTLSVVGGLVIGQAAVDARMVSVPVLIIVAVSGTCALITPKLKAAILVSRLGLTLLGVGVGLYGFLLGLIFFLLMLARQSSFGVGYLSHLPLGGSEGSQDSLTRPPLWSMKKYGRFLAWREGLRR